MTRKIIEKVLQEVLKDKEVTLTIKIKPTGKTKKIKIEKTEK